MSMWLRLLAARVLINLHALRPRYFLKFRVCEDRTYEGGTLLGAAVGLLDCATGEFHIFYEVTS